jgi:MarR family transcriptional regulator, organic hydroperoxide resistance regulator
MKQGNAIALISRVREKANRYIVRELEDHGIDGIVPSHGEILYTLFNQDRCTMKELAEKIHRSKPNVTVLVEKLSDLGYIKKEKSSQDSRVTYISLTEKGQSLRPVFFYITNKMQKIVYGSFSEKDAELFENMLLTIRDAFPPDT